MFNFIEGSFINLKINTAHLLAALRHINTIIRVSYRAGKIDAQTPGKRYQMNNYLKE